MARRPGRVTGKAARRNKWWTRRRNQWIAGGVALAVLGVGGVALALNDSSDTTTAQTPGDAWKAELVADFGTMSQAALNYLRTINDWRTDKAKPEEVDAAADLALGYFLDTRDVLVKRAAFEQAPRALTNYKDSVELYVVHARLAKLGAAVADDDKQLSRQIQLMMGRLRYVADRLYDLGSDEMAPHTTQNVEVPGFDYTRAVDVPSFAGTDLAPGPPLTLARPGAAADRQYQESRPEDSFATWQAAVESAKIPSAQAEATAIDEAPAEELDRLAYQLTEASDQLHAAADPMDERELSTRVQLGLLVQAEAMRAAQVARLVAGKERSEAKEIAKVLALLGNSMWDEARLGARDVGYPKTLLTERPAVAPPRVEVPTPPPTGAPDPAASTVPSTPPPTTG